MIVNQPSLVIQPARRKQTTAGILWRCLSYLAPYWKLTAGVYLAMVGIIIANMLTPLLIGRAVDFGIVGVDSRLLGLYICGLLAITIIKGLLVYFQGGWTEIASQSVAYDLRNAIQYKLDELSFSFHDRAQSGQILSRSIQDVERIRFLTGRAVLRLVEGSVLLLSTVVMLIVMNPGLGMLAALSLPLLLHRAYVFGRSFRPLSNEIQDQLGVLTAFIEQNLRGAQVVKGFAQEQSEIERFLIENETWFALSAESARLQSLNVPMLNLIANFGALAVLLYGGIQVMNGQLTLGALIAFFTYLAQLVRPLERIGRIVPIFTMAASSGERIFEVLDAPATVRDRPDAIQKLDIRGEVCFERVTFAYEYGRKVIEDVSFVVQPGEKVALLGQTGSGKSTIINLLTRFYDPTEGLITVDGIDTRQIGLRALREQIGIVLQDTTLFAASIRENIAFGNPDASMEVIISAAQDAQAHDFILELPHGYDTRVGERGVTLSGGQRQRIAIARALLTNPRILILDDATSSVDTQTEHQIQTALERLMESRTTFVIAHRLSTIRKADLVLLLQAGKIIAKGTHNQLLLESPEYAELYRLQLRPQDRKMYEVE